MEVIHKQGLEEIRTSQQGTGTQVMACVWVMGTQVMAWVWVLGTQGLAWVWGMGFGLASRMGKVVRKLHETRAACQNVKSPQDLSFLWGMPGKQNEPVQEAFWHHARIHLHVNAKKGLDQLIVCSTFINTVI